MRAWPCAKSPAQPSVEQCLLPNYAGRCRQPEEGCGIRLFESRHDCHLLVWRLELYFGELRPMSVHTLSSCGPQRGDESSEFVSASPGDGPDRAGGGGNWRAQGGRRL
jgi:hypothetical protein